MRIPENLKQKRFILYICLAVLFAIIAATVIAVSVGNSRKIKWKLDDTGTLTISGRGAMQDYCLVEDASNAPWYNDRDNILSVVVKDGVTGIGSLAFYDIENLTSVTLPDSLTTIGKYAFFGCSGLKNITLPDGLTTIGEWAFEDCSGLTAIKIPDSVTDIGEDAFGWCTGLTDITIPDSVTSISDYAFIGCSGLESVTIPDSVTSIGKDAFNGCSSLTEVLYNGTEEHWNAIAIDRNNESVIKARNHEEVNTYTIKYHSDDTEEASPDTTTVEYGTATAIKLISELGFSKPGYTFSGWRVYREIDNTWCLQDKNGDTDFVSMIDGELPSGYSYTLYSDGRKVSTTAISGTVHLYARWKPNSRTTFTVKYHSNNSAEASFDTTTVEYGTVTAIKKLSELGFSKHGYSFEGWRVYREIDNRWRAKDSKGNPGFVSLVNGELPSGYTYILYSDGRKVSNTADSGTVHLYAQWSPNTYTIKYHSDDAAEASPVTTTVKYETPTAIKTTAELGFDKTGYSFAGWKAHREIDDKWYARDWNNNSQFVSLINGELPSGYTYILYSDGQKVSTTASSGTVHFYAQWTPNTYTIKYHSDNTAEAYYDTTTVEYGTATAIKTIYELGFNRPGYTFEGWRVYREADNKWRVKDGNGDEKWMSNVNGELPSGYTYTLYPDGRKVSTTAPYGNVHFYAQWSK